MISSGGSQASDFDVLNSQKGDDAAIHVIKINKKIGDSVFTKAIQPTELPPVPPIVVVDGAQLNEEVKPQKKYSAPKELLDYLDILIVKKKLPLRTLKFDIEFSKSKEEVARHLEDHKEKIGNIDGPDMDKLFGFIGYGQEEVAAIPSSDTDVSTENMQVIKDVQGSLNSLAEVVSRDAVPGQVLDIKTLRDHYALTHVEYARKVKEDTVVYKIMMSQLGSSRSMPERPEPEELLEARKEYYQTRKEKKLDRESSIHESALYSDSEIPHFSIKMQERLKRAMETFDVYVNIVQLSESLLGADTSSLEKIVDPEKFEGMRVTEEAVASEVEVRKPELDAVLVPSEKIATMAIAHTEEHKEDDVTKKYDPQDVRFEIMSASGANFIPKNVVDTISAPGKAEDKSVKMVSQVVTPEVPANIVSEMRKEEVVVEKSQEKMDKDRAQPEVEEKPVEMAPVDSVVAEQPPKAQNVFPTEFEDKTLEVHHGFPGKPNEIKVFYGGREIASGLAGGRVAINKEFKAGFLLADTVEERALKHAHTIIKTLKPVK